MQKEDILEKPEYLELLLAVAAGYDYASKIANFFRDNGRIIGHGKKQPTITEQLHALKKLGFLKEKEYTKAKIYEVNFSRITARFYFVAETALKDIKYTLGTETYDVINEVGVRNIIKEKLIRDFIISYLDSLTVGMIAIKHKGISELVLGFFAAIKKLNKEDLRKLAKKYKVNEQYLLLLAEFISFYSYIPEFTSLQELSIIEEAYDKSADIEKVN
ncbi:MAG: hypothetical protein QXL94_08790 [Candidatus Parvarchaeum sp.]